MWSDPNKREKPALDAGYYSVSLLHLHWTGTCVFLSVTIDLDL